jgi:hypothetical protein
MKKVGLDIHGVIDYAPDFFSELSHSLVDAGNEVHIITGASNTEEIENKLSEFNIAYTHFFSIVDYNIDKVKYDELGDPWLDDLTWDMAKAKYCEERGIHVHIDDTPEYGKYFKSGTRFVLYEKSTMNMDMKIRAIVASAPTDCDNYPCKKNCPQFILFKDRVRKIIQNSYIYDRAWSDLMCGDNVMEKHLDLLVEDIFDNMV